MPLVILVAGVAALATLLGGAIALRLRDKLHLVLGFSAGAVIAVAFFDLLPEALELARGVHGESTVLLSAALGFFAYVILDRTLLLHTHEDDDAGEAHVHGKRGRFAAATLSGHSLLDGLAIGLAFQASPAIGAIVAIAVLTHDFSDGINTVNMILRSGGARSEVFRWLLVDALAPIVGAAATLLISVPEGALSLVLATFAGFFLYIGASDLLPESHHAHPKFLTTVMTLAGAAVLYAAITLAG